MHTEALNVTGTGPAQHGAWPPACHPMPASGWGVALSCPVTPDFDRKREKEEEREKREGLSLPLPAGGS